MTLRELMDWGMRFQMRQFREEDKVTFKCPECGGDRWEYDFEKEGHWCKKCEYFQKDL